MKAPTAIPESARPTAHGKFLWTGREKFYVKGVTYGSFPPNSAGYEFPEPSDIDNDFKLMAEVGINTILTYTVPSVSMLDQAQEFGLRVIVNIPWMGHVCFLEERGYQQKVRKEVEAAVRSLNRHPAVLMNCVAKELPPQIARWHGAKKVAAFLKDLCDVAKQEDPEALVTYTNFPTTEYLELPFVDVFTFNVYLHERAEFSSYLARLQNLAGERPLLLTELGMCSFRHGRDGQARFIDWQLEEAFEKGLAGAVIFGWTDPFYQDNCLVEEWGFGLVDSERRPKPSYDVARRRFAKSTAFPSDRQWPKVSVVVALHNAASTLDDCLSSLLKLNYPNYEVIVVNDGSTDESQSIIDRYPFRGIETANQGVSGARNEGLRAATGKIVAYIDSDAKADPDWLSYLVTTFLSSNLVGVGGPNLVPPEDEWVAKCVYRSPGGPTQVMLDDTSAEHIPGCNMAFYKWALDEIGGFDPLFRAAGDDVDICWRLLQKGHRLGFSPSAVVWHHRRPAVRAYWRQQVGYGKSEALLERRHPNKFNPWGHTFWGGRIYAPYPFFRLLGRPVIYQGLWGSAGFQSIYDPGQGGALSFLPRAMEWHVALGSLAFIGIFSPWVLVLVGAGLAYTVAYCFSCAYAANLDVLLETEPHPSWFRRFQWRAMIALLHFLEPLARDWGRLLGGLTPWRGAVLSARPKHRTSRWWQRLQPFSRSLHWFYHGGTGLDKYPFLERLTNKLNGVRCAVGWNPDTEDWDLKIRRGVLGIATTRAVVEHHGGPKRLARLAVRIRANPSIYWAQATLCVLGGAFFAGGLHLPLAVVLAFLTALWIAPVVEANRLEAALRSAADEVAWELAIQSPLAAEAASAQSQKKTAGSEPSAPAQSAEAAGGTHG